MQLDSLYGAYTTQKKIKNTTKQGGGENLHQYQDLN
jgi:hypothetical protein